MFSLLRFASSCRHARPVSAIDQVFVKLDENVSLEESNFYARKHPELNFVVKEILDIVCKPNPDDPVDTIQSHFLSIKGSRPEATGHDDTLDQLLLGLRTGNVFKV